MRSHHGRTNRITLALVGALALVSLALVAFAFARPALDRAAAPREQPVASLGLGGKPYTVAFLGDSYTAGAGVAPQDAWPSLLGEKRGWKVINLARGGTGYLKGYTNGGQAACGQDACPNYLDMVPQAIAAAPDMVIVSGGRNDGAQVTAVLEQNIKDVYTRLRQGLPKAKILATSPILAADDSPAAFPQLRPDVKAAVEAAGGTYLDLAEPLAGHPDLVQGDGVHPNSAGQKALADAVDRLLAPLVG